jgi:hypothetical protein
MAVPVRNAEGRPIGVLGASSRDPDSGLDSPEAAGDLFGAAAVCARILVDLLGWANDEPTGQAGQAGRAGQANPAAQAGQAGQADSAGQAGRVGQADPAEPVGPAPARLAGEQPSDDADELGQRRETGGQ